MKLVSSFSSALQAAAEGALRCRMPSVWEQTNSPMQQTTSPLRLGVLVARPPCAPSSQLIGESLAGPPRDLDTLKLLSFFCNAFARLLLPPKLRSSGKWGAGFTRRTGDVPDTPTDTSHPS